MSAAMPMTSSAKMAASTVSAHSRSHWQALDVRNGCRKQPPRVPLRKQEET